jgi:hypothetical protein
VVPVVVVVSILNQVALARLGKVSPEVAQVHLAHHSEQVVAVELVLSVVIRQVAEPLV